MSDTPETDSLCTEHPKGTSAYIMELIDLCRKMERERNEAAQSESKLDALVEHHTRMIIAHAKEVDALMWAQPADPRYARFGEAMWKYITDQGGDFCGEEISEDILPLAQAAECPATIIIALGDN
jgi:hypothetical protein